MELLWGDSSPRCHRGNYLVPVKEVVLVALGAQATRSRTSSDSRWHCHLEQPPCVHTATLTLPPSEATRSATLTAACLTAAGIAALYSRCYTLP